MTVHNNHTFRPVDFMPSLAMSPPFMYTFLHTDDDDDDDDDGDDDQRGETSNGIYLPQNN